MQRAVLIDAASIATTPQLVPWCRQLIRADLNFFAGLYPGFANWFDRQVVPGLTNGERTILIEQRYGETAGLLILKNSVHERKICTLRVRDHFQNRGLGVRLFEKAFAILGTTAPLLSASQENLQAFDRLFRYFGFRFEREYEGLYRPYRSEFSFNGLLVSTRPNVADWHRPRLGHSLQGLTAI
jgi:ribosomal protein S18 acetylase RimI-like enzyme